MRLIIVAFAFLLTGCLATPVKRNFPEAPDVLKERCPVLEKVADDVKLSELTKTIATNYTTYYDCSVKMDAWIEWYRVQKQIFETVK